MGRKQTDIDRIAELERDRTELMQGISAISKALNTRRDAGIVAQTENCLRAIQKLVDANEAQEKELFDATTFVRKMKAWVRELPIEARIDMPELQQ